MQLPCVSPSWKKLACIVTCEGKMIAIGHWPDEKNNETASNIFYGPHDELMSIPCAQKQIICQQVLEQDTEAAR